MPNVLCQCQIASSVLQPCLVNHIASNDKKNSKHFSSERFYSNRCLALLPRKDVIIGPATFPYMEETEARNNSYGIGAISLRSVDIHRYIYFCE